MHQQRKWLQQHYNQQKLKQQRQSTPKATIKTLTTTTVKKRKLQTHLTLSRSCFRRLAPGKIIKNAKMTVNHISTQTIQLGLLIYVGRRHSQYILPISTIIE